MLLGSLLAYLAITRGATAAHAIDPTYLYQTVFNYLTDSPTASLVLAGLMVVISQMKINVTNAYAGSIAWSNFFSRLTHSHPGRVVWLVFNVTIALILMELGIYRVLEAILGVFAIVAVSWLGCLSADLMINKPLGLSASYVEFKRAHLYDVNPVGVVSLVLASALGFLSYLGTFGEALSHLAHFVSLASCFVSVPLVAWLTKGRFYLARQSPELGSPLQLTDITATTPHTLQCCICENSFEREDVSYCPAYQGAICSLCCSLDSRCLDSCKPGARFSEQVLALLQPLLPEKVLNIVSSRFAQFGAILLIVNGLTAVLLMLIYYQMSPLQPAEATLLQQAMVAVFFIFLIVSGVVSWLFLLAHESRVVAQQESTRQTQRLIQEIEAHMETDQQLQQAKEQAERANSAKSRYLTGISHELRTPLQSILGYAQLLTRRQDLPPQQHNALQIIKRSGEHLAGLIEGLLDISKIEAGRLDIYRNKVNLPELIQQLVSMFSEQAHEKGIIFNCHIPHRLPAYVIADEKRLKQILINLLSNAIKYTEKGGVDFHIRYRHQVAEFSVVDTGVGIHEHDMQRILDPFERVRSPEVPNVTGTGLGLTIVKLLTDIMGGDLKISSTPGLGSTFTVTLMFSWIDDPTKGMQASRMITGYQGGRRLVMVVDDEPIHRGLLFDLLNPLGFTTLEARDAQSCLTQLLTVDPDMFLLDVNMPGMNGLELAATLRSRGITVPIVMISADAQEHHRHPEQQAAHDEYLVKPVNHQGLLETMGRLLQLEWTYADSEPALPRALPATAEKHVLPDHPLLRELLAYAQIGHKHGVSSKLDEIEQAGLLESTTLTAFRDLVQRMQLMHLAQTLEKQTS
jgi:signal transduction histidine kinase/DNA-binding NarL/FixJ family response regulator